MKELPKIYFADEPFFLLWQIAHAVLEVQAGPKHPFAVPAGVAVIDVV